MEIFTTHIQSLEAQLTTAHSRAQAELGHVDTQYEADLQEMNQVAYTSAKVGAGCLAISGVSFAVGYTAEKVDSALQGAVSLHQTTEAAVQQVAQTIADGAEASVVGFGAAGLMGLTVAGIFGSVSWVAERDYQRGKKDSAHRRMRAAEHQKVIDSVFG